MSEEFLDSYEIEETNNNQNDDNNTNDTDQQPTALGVDDSEEVVVKKRKVVAKLDSERLLSDKGIPNLKNSVVPKIKLKGKGHEKGDLRRILYSYQMWAHTVFPKAKFEDFIELAKKAGKQKSLKEHRKQWIYEEKHGFDFSKSTEAINDLAQEGEEETHGQPARVDSEATAPADEDDGENDLFMGGVQGNDDDDDDEIPVIRSQPRNQQQRPFGDDDDEGLYGDNSNNNNNTNEDEIPNDDELEELMSGQQQQQNNDDELEANAMAAADELGF